MQKETREQLELFRKHQEEAERKAIEEDNSELPKEGQVQWAAPGRKRKKGHENSLLKGVKLRKSSSAAEEPKLNVIADEQGSTVNAHEFATNAATMTTAIAPAGSSLPKTSSTLSLGLGYASSDDEEN